MNTVEKLNQLAEYQAKADVLALDKQRLIDTLISPEIKAQIDEINYEFATQLEALDTNIAALTADIKADVVQGGASVKGAHLQAVYAKGRVSWDSKMLDGLAIAIPEVAKARKEGAPSVSIRNI